MPAFNYWYADYLVVIYRWVELASWITEGKHHAMELSRKELEAQDRLLENNLSET